MPATKAEQLRIIKQFLDWFMYVEDADEVVKRYADEVLTECDTAIGHGPGHQSISPCIITGTHDVHYAAGREWCDSDISEQIGHRTRYKAPDFTEQVTRTYRLAFSRDW